ncbi:mug89 [Candida pseudojiufengensis]|uniref:mug89 n=1 Tax=Candida pseudojiufengensis TaxID=497109 RepID=UPI002224408E|nr:mug89 [Candida pseudojiufengensis]KAI5963233.1 mug89 [Candida pseudojiufengensis]
MNFLRKRRPSNSSDDDEDQSNLSQIKKSRKPPNTAFRQQRLQAWQPILTPRSVIPFLFLLAVIFAPLGIAIIYTTYNVQELNIDYSKCHLQSDKFESIPDKYTGFHFKSNTKPDFKWRVENLTATDYDYQKCIIQFNMPDLKAPLYLYYKLTNFYQNHRKFVESYDLDQLGGKDLSSDSVTDNCKPLKHREYNGEQRLIYPCGLIANSYFNDTISSPVLLNARNGNDNETYEFTDKDISWSSDRNHKFKMTTYNPEDVVPPPNWDRMFPQGYNESNMPNVQKWEHLQNWMRTAALPNFYKLYGQNTTQTLSSGTYEISIDLNYPVEIFGGTKSIVITNNNVFGGRNVSLGVIYMIVAVISLVLGLGFLLQFLIKPRKIGDHNYLQEGEIINYRDQL